jgi:two-component system response regulator LytT
MEILIIEKDTGASAHLEELICALDENYRIGKSISSIDEAIIWLRSNKRPELIFIDLPVSDENLMLNLFLSEFKIPIIFTSSEREQIWNALKYSGFDFLLKPISLPCLLSSIQKFYNLSQIFDGGNQPKSKIDLDGQVQYKTRFLLKVGERLFFKESNEVAYFIAEQKSVFLVTEEGQRYLIDYSLDKLGEVVNPKNFFRINRQVIARISAMKEFRLFGNGRLKVFLKAGQHSQNAIVSRQRVSTFKEWAEM